MEYLDQYSIPIQSIQLGLHQYKFEIEDAFFNYFENALIKSGKYDVNLILEKKENQFVLNFQIDGFFNASCDRCMTKIDIQTSIEKLIWVIYSNENQVDDLDENIICIDESEYKFNVSDLIYELIMLSMPMSMTYDCENDPNPKCDFEILKYLDREIEKSKGNSFAKELKKISKN